MKQHNHKNTISSFLIWGVVDIYFILSVTLAILSGVLLPSIQLELKLSTTQLGLLGSAFFLVFGAVQSIAGKCIDGKGPRLTLGISGCIAAGGFFLLRYADSFIWAMIAQMVLGVGFSTAYVGAIYLAQTWFSEKYFPFFSGITLMSANIMSSLILFGMAMTGVILVDFRIISMQLGVITGVVSILMFLIVKRAPHGARTSQGKSNNALFGADLYRLFSVPQFWFGVLFFGTNFGVFLTFSSLWNIPNSIAYGHSLETATVLSATLRFGAAFGALISGFMIKFVKRCSTVAKWYSTGTLCLTLLLIYGPVFPLALTFVIMGLLGFFFGGTAVGFPLVAQHIPASLKGTGFGLMTSLGYLLCAFLEYLVGVFLSFTHKTNRIETVSEFKIALTSLVVVVVIGWISSLKLRESAQ